MRQATKMQRLLCTLKRAGESVPSRFVFDHCGAFDSAGHNPGGQLGFLRARLVSKQPSRPWIAQGLKLGFRRPRLEFETSVVIGTWNPGFGRGSGWGTNHFSLRLFAFLRGRSLPCIPYRLSASRGISKCVHQPTGVGCVREADHRSRSFL